MEPCLEMQFREIARGSAEEARLLDSAAARHGAWLRQAATLLERWFLLGSEWAPGLRFVGGGTSADVARRLGLPPRPMSVGAARTDLIDAVAACLGEAAERTAQLERSGDVAVRAAPGRVRLTDQMRTRLTEITGDDTAWTGRDTAWLIADRLDGGPASLVPADWCLRRHAPGELADGSAPLSLGCAAGAKFEDAVAGGLRELIERDAVALWWNGVHAARCVADDSPAGAAMQSLLAELRAGFDGRRTWLLDITTDFDVPVYVAASSTHDGDDLTCGMAAAADPADAARSAVLEMCQMEVGLQLAHAKREQLGEDRLSDGDRLHIERAGLLRTTAAGLFTPSGTPRHEQNGQSQPHALSTMLAALVANDVEIYALDLTREDCPIAVAKVIAPRLQPFPSAVAGRRLLHAAGDGQFSFNPLRLL